jgi:hypothetical protein
MKKICIYIFGYKEEWNYVICKNMEELEIIMLSEMSAAQKDKHCLLLLMCRPWTESSSPSYDMNVEGRLLGRDSRG